MCPCSVSCHLSHLEQVHLEEKAQRTACDLVRSPADGITQFAPYGQTISLDRLEDGEEK